MTSSSSRSRRCEEEEEESSLGEVGVETDLGTMELKE